MQHVKQTEGSKPFPPPFHSCGNFKVSYKEDLKLFQTDFSRRFMIFGILCLFALAPFFNSNYLLHILSMIGIYAIAGVGLNILTGYTGQLSLGHGAFFGVGAYASAFLAAKAGFPFFLVIPIAGIVASMVGTIFALPAIRLKFIYLAVATLAGQFIIEYGLVQWASLTGGTKGFVVPAPTLAGLNPGTNLTVFYIIYICLVLMTWLVSNLIRSKTGRAFLAIRQNNRAAEAMGIAVFPHKLLAFAISSFFAGVAGALFAYNATVITPAMFNLRLSIELPAVILIGGIGSISGSILGALAIVSLNEILTLITEYFMNAGAHAVTGIATTPLHEFVLGLAIVLVIIFKPQGLINAWCAIKSSFRKWPFS